MDPLDLRKIRVLVGVTETGSATKAGKQLHLGQSAVSQTLKEIQDDLGIMLFERVGRGLVPTAAGLRLADEGRRVLAALTRANMVAGALQQGRQQDEIHVGVMTAFIHGEIARCMARFSNEHSELSLTLDSYGKEKLIEQVAHGDLDIAVAIGGVDVSGVTTFATISMRVVCIVPPGHTLAGRKSVKEHQLREYRQVTLTAGSPLRVALEATGIAVDTERMSGNIHVGTQRAIVTMVEAGAGVALVDPLVLSPEDKVTVLKFEPAVHVNLSMFARDDWQDYPYVKELALQLYESLAPLSSDSVIAT